MPQLPPLGAEISGDVVGLPPIGGEVSPQADFRVENEKDQSGQATVDPNTLGTVLRHTWNGILSTGQMLPFPKAAGGSGLDNPLFPSNILKAAKAVKAEGDAAWEKGDKVTAAAKYIESLIPLIGPSMSNLGNQLQQGKYAAAGGDLIPVAAGFGADAIPALKARVPGVSPASTAEAEAVRFGQAQGIPVDAATATGNRAVRAVQHVADRSLAGSVVAEKAASRTNAALAQTGEGLAARVHPDAVTAEQAGAGVRGAVTDLIGDLHQQATEAYGKLRQFEAQSPEQVPAPIAITPIKKARMTATLHQIPSQSELQELRNIGAELEAVPFQRGRLTVDTSTPTGSSQYVRRQANAPVYQDIRQFAPGTSEMTGAQMAQSIKAAVETGLFNNAARGALEVAKQRLAGSRQVSSPMLVKPGTAVETQTMLLPVDVRDVKSAIQPLYDRLKREAELVPLQGGKARTLTALDRLVNGPDHAPVSVADEALSDLKSMARGAVMPELRSVAQGRAAYAVKQLDQAVRDAVAKAGPEASQALETGRGATIAKYAAAEVLDSLNAEPVKTFRTATTPKDAAIGHLRQLAEYAPNEVPKLGRAVLEDMLGKATEAGGFDHTAKLYADWQKLGPETKRILFGSVTPELDKFFLLAKKLGENPNPSGTAHTLAVAGQTAELVYNPIAGLVTQIGAGGLSALLHSKVGVKLLTRGVTLKLAKAPQVVQAAAWADVLNAARTTRGPVALPAAAGDQNTAPPAETRQ